MSLRTDLDRVLAESADVASSTYLTSAREDVLLIEEQAQGCAELSKRVKHLGKQLAQSHFALDSEAINRFLQELAEAQFFALCRSRGISLQAIPTQSHQGTPDYSLNGDPTTTFEVKALSVVDGHLGIRRDLNKSLDAKVTLESQRLGSRITTFVEMETSAYGNKLRSTHVNLDHLNVYVEKVRQNIKRDQFSAPRSFLVLNLTALPGLGRDLGDLRPIYWDELPSPHPVSGAIWMLAFGQSGMAVFGHPEFEGSPGIEGYFRKEGILNENREVAGIIVVRRELDGKLNVGALFRSEDWGAWSSEESGWEWIKALVHEKWNDELDSNGWQL